LNRNGWDIANREKELCRVQAKAKHRISCNLVMRDNRLVGMRVELASSLIDKIPEHGHQCS
jgi:hypothetical protein